MKYTVKELCDKKVAILTPTLESFNTIIEMLKRHGVGGLCDVCEKARKQAFEQYRKNTFVIVVKAYLPFMSRKYNLVFGDKVDIDDDCVIDDGKNLQVSSEEGMVRLEIEIKAGQNVFDVLSEWIEKNRKQKTEDLVGRIGIFSYSDKATLKDVEEGDAILGKLTRIGTSEDGGVGYYGENIGPYRSFRLLTTEEKALL